MLIILSHLSIGFRVSPPLDPRRKPALWLMRRGVLTLGEIGRELHVSRQRVRYWAEQSGFNYRARRENFVRRVLQQAMKARGR
jgi:DNA-directed RNA polymerase sigma subunit (sigma70/sigma32)